MMREKALEAAADDPEAEHPGGRAKARRRRYEKP